MPEGPSVKRFQLLTAPFVGQVVAKVGGSSRQRNLKDLKAMRLQDSQVSYIYWNWKRFRKGQQK
uniref:Uncharacterized protein n=1 Tax=Terrapene triunguis TaxID=2587831 RepID=A0A674J8G8_9SAUR